MKICLEIDTCLLIPTVPKPLNINVKISQTFNTSIISCITVITSKLFWPKLCHHGCHHVFCLLRKRGENKATYRKLIFMTLLMIHVFAAENRATVIS